MADGIPGEPEVVGEDAAVAREDRGRRVERLRMGKRDVSVPRGTAVLDGLSDEGKAGIYNKIAQGVSIDALAKEYGVSYWTMYCWLALTEECSQARAMYLTTQLGRAIENLEQAKDGLQLAKGRELFNAWRWKAERLARKHYGQDPMVQVQVNLTPEQAQARIRVLEQELGIGGKDG